MGEYTRKEAIAIQKQFPNYRLSKADKEVIFDFTLQTGYDLIGTDDAVDKETFKHCLERNVTWLKDWAQEASNNMDSYASQIYVD